MKKKFCRFIIICLLFVVSPISPMYPMNTGMTAKAAVSSYEKSISITYSGHDYIPTTIEYSEVVDNQKYAGTLSISNIFAWNILYQYKMVTYTGTLYPVSAE